MGDAAHAGSQKHTVFNKPFKVTPKVETWDTPSNYRRFPGGDKLPDKIDVWKIQNTGKSFGGVVSRSYGFEDSPDAEVIVRGFNTGKEHGAVGIGRHGNILQWGYSAEPSRMTNEGRKLFVNCIHYIKAFDGKVPLVHREGYPRENAPRLAALIKKIKRNDFFETTFPVELKTKYENDPEGLVKYYEDNFELIYRDGVFLIDNELKSLDLNSNRSIQTLQRLIEMLDDPEKAPTAKTLLDRYTNLGFGESAKWKQWFEENRDNIFFSDFGGYKFLVAPDSYLN